MRYLAAHIYFEHSFIVTCEGEARNRAKLGERPHFLRHRLCDALGFSASYFLAVRREKTA
jgi:hypothetical protein